MHEYLTFYLETLGSDFKRTLCTYISLFAFKLLIKEVAALTGSFKGWECVRAEIYLM
jgi:hypothetical protein